MRIEKHLWVSKMRKIVLIYVIPFIRLVSADDPSIYFKVENLAKQVIAGNSFAVQVTTGLPFCRGIPPLFSIVFDRQITYKSPFIDPTKTGILADSRISSCTAGTYQLTGMVTIAGDYQQSVFFYVELFDGDITTQGPFSAASLYSQIFTLSMRRFHPCRFCQLRIV